MVGIYEQIDSGKLVCPKTHQPLRLEGLATLVSADGAHSYSFEDGVPILIADPTRQEDYRKQQDGAMHAEYAGQRPRSIFRTLAARIASMGADHRSEASEAAFQAVVGDQPKEALCLSVGGGPTRVHENLVNVNIDLFENVDVVADAYALPYAAAQVARCSRQHPSCRRFTPIRTTSKTSPWSGITASSNGPVSSFAPPERAWGQRSRSPILPACTCDRSYQQDWQAAPSGLLPGSFSSR